uniref:Uncharacterized protein n=1 Tax=Anguilla anguilla TaxID=7936 RepID=A0A0E9UIH8_ANGAN
MHNRQADYINTWKRSTIIVVLNVLLCTRIKILSK